MRSPVDPLEEIYIDETNLGGERFLVLGGILLPSRLSHQFERAIAEARSPHLAVQLKPKKNGAQIQETEIGWNDVSTRDFSHYKKIVDRFFSFRNEHLGNTSLEHMRFYCSVVDTHVRGRRYSGKAGQVGFNREIYFHCMTIARTHKTKHFHVYPDERTTNVTMEQMRRMLNSGFWKEDKLRDKPFKRVEFRLSHQSQAMQVSDIFIGAVAYRLNHFDKPGGDDKKALCEYILREGKFWDHVGQTGFRPKPFGEFQVWFRRHKS